MSNPYNNSLDELLKTLDSNHKGKGEIYSEGFRAGLETAANWVMQSNGLLVYRDRWLFNNEQGHYSVKEIDLEKTKKMIANNIRSIEVPE